MKRKKYKPTLLELIHKGDLSTPEWFYNKDKDHAREPGPVESETEPEGPGQGLGPMEPGQDEDSERTIPKPWVRLTDPTFFSSLSYWKIVLIVLAVILLASILYRLSRGGPEIAAVPGSEKTLLDPAPAKSEPGPSQSPPRQAEKAPSPARKAAVPAEKPAAPAPKSTVEEKPAPRSGQCLILCSYGDPEKLEPVREYFSQQGVHTEIGRFGGLAVLYSWQTFEDSRSSEAVSFQKRLGKLGSGYDRQKPKDALGFSRAFEQTYYVNITRIQ